MALVVTERCWVICTTTISSSDSLERCYQSALFYNKLAKHMKTFSYSDAQSKCAMGKRWCPSSSTTCTALPAALHAPVPPEHKLDCSTNKQKSSTDFSLFMLYNICQSQTGRSGFGFNWDTRSPPEPENHTRENEILRHNKHVFMRY